MKKITFLTFISFLLFNSVNAQVLYSENFETYTVGNLFTDIGGQKIGQGGWYTRISSQNYSKNENHRIESEKGRGKFLILESTHIDERYQPKRFVRTANKGISLDWNNRDKNNNILKIEFEFNYEFNSQTNNELIVFTITSSTLSNHSHGISIVGDGKNEVIKDYYGAPDLSIPSFFANPTTWQKIIIYIDFNNFETFVEFPSRNYAVKSNIPMHKRDDASLFDDIEFTQHANDNFFRTAFFKIDNIKISAVNTLPTLYIIDLDASKFNLYPNPATNIVNINNSENMSVKQIEIYDLAGKLINTQNFNNEADIQLNIETFTSGTYLLYLHTDEGTAIKKFIKK